MKTFKQWFFAAALFVAASAGFAQVTTSSVSGNVKDNKGVNIYGATIEAVHRPSGTKYFATTNAVGNYGINSVRPGGPYTIKVSFVSFKSVVIDDQYAALGNGINFDVVLEDEASVLKEVVVTSSRSGLISKNRTGASQQFSKREINAVPIIGSRTINDITKYNANGNGRSFGSQDSRLNNFTIDGSVFNNGFGLGNTAQAGGRTGSTAISLDAIEQLQVNIAPFDVRQSGFVGAGINAVTRSGTNELEGSVYMSYKDNKSAFLGTRAAGIDIVPSKFSDQIYGIRIGAPIIKNKLFIFANYEGARSVQPATTWTATGSPNPSSQVSTPTFAQMTTLSNYLSTTFGYQTGPFENFDNKSNSDKFLVKLDFNLNDNNKISARYVWHNSTADVNMSNSRALGNGDRTTRQESMSFQNSGYVIQDNTRSTVIEWNSKLSSTWDLNLILGYDKQIEDRKDATLFPTVDIRNNGANAPTLISFGTDPFTPSNRLDYSNLHGTLNITKRLNKHTILLGTNYEMFQSNNSFFPGSHGVYVFNSLADFYTAAGQSAANNGAPSTFVPARFQLRYSALPGGAEPLQVLKSNKLDLYVQDEIKFNNQFKVTLGLRASIVDFENTAITNPTVLNYAFLNGKKYDTGLMPEQQLLWEPRVGMNLDVFGNSKTQLRGGFGMFTGRPPYVFVSNQIGNNGILTGFIDDANPALPNYGFTPNPAQYFIPANAATAIPATFDLAFTETNYKFPQVFKIDLAWDQKLPGGFIGSVEGIFNKNVNETFYYNANQANAIGTFAGPDNRPRFARTQVGTRIQSNVSNAIVLGNSSRGFYQSVTFKLDYPSNHGVFGSLAYTRSESRDLMSAGSIASSSFQGANSVNGNNDLKLSLSDNDIPHRIVGLLGYRFEYGKYIMGATTFNIGYIGEQSGRFSHTINGDMNGDLVNNNDLMFIPNNGNQINFENYTLNGNTYTAAQQQQAFEFYIANDPYLNERRGQYAERNAIAIPMLHRVDLSVTQDISFKIGKKLQSFQVRADILNFGNLLNNEWGVSQRSTLPRLLTYRSTNGAGEPVYRMGTQIYPDGTSQLVKDRFVKNTSQFEVWQAQLTLRYSF